jgi:hypothetical protein
VNFHPKLIYIIFLEGAHGSIVGRGTMLLVGRSWVQDPIRSMKFPIYLILPAILGAGVYSASNKNEYQNMKKMFMGSTAQLANKADNLTTICESVV